MENNSLIKQNQATRLAKKFVRVFRKHHTGKKKKKLAKPICKYKSPCTLQKRTNHCNQLLSLFSSFSKNEYSRCNSYSWLSFIANKSKVIQRQILCDITYIWSQKDAQTQQNENRLILLSLPSLVMSSLLSLPSF